VAEKKTADKKKVTEEKTNKGKQPAKMLLARRPR
jgi:hypothetical protein